MVCNVVSFSLWGSNPVYNHGLEENIKLIRELLPGFQTWVFCTKDILPSTRTFCLETPLVKLIERDETPGFYCTSWRFEPMFDSEVDVCLSRDADSRITRREVAIVMDWIQSSRHTFQIIRDDKNHHSKIMAGMCAAKRGAVGGLREAFFNCFKGTRTYGSDETALKTVLYPHVLPFSLVYLGRGARGYPNEEIRTIPDPDPGVPFIGEVVCEVDGQTYRRVRSHTVMPYESYLFKLGLLILVVVLVFFALRFLKRS